MTAIVLESGPRLKKGNRRITFLPWLAKTPAPWKKGYSRVFVHYSAAERAKRRDNKRGYEAIVNNANIEGA